MTSPVYSAPDEIPVRAGIGLRAEHFDAVLDRLPDVGWFEAHSENYFGLNRDNSQQESNPPAFGGKPLLFLEQVREHYPVSLHGVGMSLGSTDPMDMHHLKQLKQLIDFIEPGLISEHLSWSSVEGQYFNDLLPLPYTEEALKHMVERISRVQDFLGRQILIENASSYLEFEASVIPEWEFVAELASRADCHVLLDVNNVYVNAKNHHFDPLVFLQAISVDSVKEIHLAGHALKIFNQGELRIDTHDRRVCDEVWTLYAKAVDRFTHVPVLIEWDSNLPDLDVLLKEAMQADSILMANAQQINTPAECPL